MKKIILLSIILLLGSVVCFTYEKIIQERKTITVCDMCKKEIKRENKYRVVEINQQTSGYYGYHARIFYYRYDVCLNCYKKYFKFFEQLKNIKKNK